MKNLDNLPQIFIDIYNIEHATFTNKLRYEILEDIINENKYETIAELGCGMGWPALYILNNCPSIKEYIAIDPGPPHNNRGEKFESSYFDIFPSGKFMNTTAHEAVTHFQDDYFDLVYVDHLVHIEDDQKLYDLKLWLNKVKPNGFFCGHDYDTIRGSHKSTVSAIHQVFGDSFSLIPEKQNNIWVVRKIGE
jgi:SAM-dependent methyltransferase